MTFAVLCPGQGGQHAAMLDFALEHAESAQVLDVATTVLGVDPRDWVRQPQALHENATAQPLICVTQLATWTALAGALPRPALHAGYSVGELACYALAGSLDAVGVAQLARRRAELMDQAAARNRGGLLAVRGLSRRQVAALCESSDASVAIAVDDNAFVVGGTAAALDDFRQRAAATGAQLTELKVGVPSHTPLLAAAAAAFRDDLQRLLERPPATPVLAGIDGSAVHTRAHAIEALAAQIAQTVEWSRCVDSLYEHGCRLFLELGPGRALSKMVRDRHADAQARSVEEFSSRGAVVDWVLRGLGSAG